MRAAVLLGFAVMACSAEPRLAELSAPIIGGIADRGHPAVVYLEWNDHLCSGTLISSKIVLTAAHCVNHEGSITAPRRVVFGSSSTDTESLGGATAYSNPGFDPAFFDNDVGIIVLGRRAEVEPMPLHFATPPEQGNVTLVGFGLRVAGDGTTGGEKQLKTMAIDPDIKEELEDAGISTAQLIVTGPSMCSGDSGGPALLTVDGKEKVAGVISFTDQNCALYGASQRVDIHRAWIEGLMATHDPISCERDFRCATGCPSADPDCPCSAVDGHCSALCEDPESDPDCPRGCGPGDTCVTGPTCPAPDPDCGDPCGAEGHCLETCATRDPDCPAPKPMGAACERTFDCLTTAVCLAKVCTATCDPLDGASCDDDSTCTRVNTEIAVCLAKPDTGGGGCSAGGGVTGRGGAGVALLALALVILAGVARRRRVRAATSSCAGA